VRAITQLVSGLHSIPLHTTAIRKAHLHGYGQFTMHQKPRGAEMQVSYSG
jgi:hypothetical protein